MRNWSRLTLAILFLGMILAGCNDLPKPAPEPTTEVQPEPTVSTQWFWQPAVWETNGPAHQWFIDTIKNTNWILTGAQQINNTMQGNNQSLNWSVAQQKWDSSSNTVRVFVPFYLGGTGIIVEIRPTFFYIGAHTADVVDASHISFRFDNSYGGIDITGVIRINRDSTAGRMTVRYSNSTTGALMREVLSPGNATTGELQSLSYPTLGITSIVVTPVCPQSIVVTPPPTCTTSPNTPGTCVMALSTGTPTTCKPTTPIDWSPPNVQDCINRRAAIAKAWKSFQNASQKMDAVNIGIGGGCVGAIISWTIGNAPIGVGASITCLTALLNRASAAEAMEDARQNALDLEAAYVALCGRGQH